MAGRRNSFTDGFLNEMRQNAAQNSDRYAQILESLGSIDDNLSHLTDIDENLKRLVNGKGFQSQGNARDTRDSSNRRSPFGDHHANFRSNRTTGNAGRGFTDAFEKALFDSLGGSDLKKRVRDSLNKFAATMGTDIEHLGDELGEQIGNMAANSIKNSKLGKKLEDKFGGLADKIFGTGTDSINDMLKRMKDNPDADLSFFADELKNLDLGTFGNIVKNAGSGIFKVVNKLTGGIGGPLLAMKLLAQAEEGLTRITEGLSVGLKALSESANRYYKSREKNIEDANKRLLADTETLIKTPFEILRKSAEEVYQAWNANIRLIAGTQGYTKADLQDLMAAYSARIQSEGLQSVIPATDVYNNLAKVIQAGLTGRGAVEFAYQATKYGAAIPSQDFFGYVESYSSVVANAIAAGKSEAEALEIANRSLEDFANNLLYASRELTGGYGTGLKAADSIYNASVRIAQAARSENINQISSSLLAIQGYVGAVAPDLATTLSDKIYQLVTGGNTSDIVALRSLAGINASNTEFIRAFSQNPQAVLANMFASLGRMYAQSPDAYMEKAEGYASLFGLSSEAFQRIDFMSLSNAITNMSTNSNSLDQNMKLLKEGQTTTSTDQLKIAQINKYMIEEGLAYVIDNEAAQMIQQHMWDEQIAREMREAEYGVNLVGGAALALEKIVSGVEFIVNLLNPISWLSKIANVVKTADEAVDIQEDIKSILKQSVVGQGNRVDYYNLTTRNRDLNLTRSLVEMMGGIARYGNSWYNGTAGSIVNFLMHPVTGLYDAAKSLRLESTDNLPSFRTGSVNSNLPSSQYSWGSISKSAANLANQILKSGVSADVSHDVVTTATGAVSASVAVMKSKVDKLLADEYLTEQFVKQGKSYQEWLQSAKNQGIVDMESAMAEAGYDTASVEEYFKAKQTEAGMAEKLAQAEEEKLFRQTGLNFWGTRFWEEYSTPVTSKIDTLIALHSEWKSMQSSKLQSIIDGQVDWKTYFDTTWIENSWKTDFIGESGYFTRFFDEFVKKFVEHTYYNESGYSYNDVVEVQRKEKAEQGDAVYALAEALTGNLVDLKDPQVQTNAILSQILIVVSAIMNQNNNVAGTMSIADALSGLALGLTTRTPLNETPVSTTAG